MRGVRGCPNTPGRRPFDFTIMVQGKHLKWKRINELFKQYKTSIHPTMDHGYHNQAIQRNTSKLK
jgi:hypothetical protein